MDDFNHCRAVSLAVLNSACLLLASRFKQKTTRGTRPFVFAFEGCERSTWRENSFTYLLVVVVVVIFTVYFPRRKMGWPTFSWLAFADPVTGKGKKTGRGKKTPRADQFPFSIHIWTSEVGALFVLESRFTVLETDEAGPNERRWWSRHRRGREARRRLSSCTRRPLETWGHRVRHEPASEMNKNNPKNVFGHSRWLFFFFFSCFSVHLKQVHAINPIDGFNASITSTWRRGHLYWQLVLFHTWNINASRSRHATIVTGGLFL